MSVPIAPLRNSHLSFSRVTRLETCMLSYFLHYVERRVPEPGVPLRFGKGIHAVCETLVGEVVQEESVRSLSEERAIALLGDAFQREGLTGADIFHEAATILRRFVHDQGVVDHRAVLGLEKEFRLQVGAFTVLGYIDRVNALDDETIEIVDYKSNRLLFSRDEVESSLQFSIYAAAARQLWPWAKKVVLTFDMLRHSVKQVTTRTEEQIADALAYVEMLGHRAETATEFPPTLNSNCVYCDHRRGCSAYAKALEEGKPEFICEDLTDLEAVAREREEVAKRAKVLYARKEELDAIIKTHLQDHDHLVLAGVRYRVLNTTSLDYPLEPTATLLADATGLEHDDVVSKLAAVDKKALDALVKRVARKVDKPHLAMFKAELEAHAEKSFSPRLWASEAK